MLKEIRKLVASWLDPEPSAMISLMNEKFRIECANSQRLREKVYELEMVEHDLQVKLTVSAIYKYKALNWDHLVKSHETGELADAFVVCRLDEHGVLSPITCQKDELSAAIYIDRTKHGTVKAN